jgi:hypothetical protein
MPQMEGKTGAGLLVIDTGPGLSPTPVKGRPLVFPGVPVPNLPVGLFFLACRPAPGG